MNASNLGVLKDQVILITGASSGLGKELAYYLAQKQAKLILVGRNLKNLKSIEKELKRDQVTCISYRCDVSVKEEVMRCIDRSIRKFGRIDYLIANAGVTMWNKFCELEDPDVLKKIIETNYMGVVYCCHYLIAKMKQKSFSCKLVFISSLQSILGIPYHTGYSASKHALDGFIKSLSLEETGSGENKLSFLNIVLSWVRGTNLRKNAFGNELVESRNQPVKKVNKFSLSSFINQLLVIEVKECAEKIVTLMLTSKQKIYLPRVTFLVPYFLLFFPNWVGKKIEKIVHKEKSLGQ